MKQELIKNLPECSEYKRISTAIDLLIYSSFPHLKSS